MIYENHFFGVNIHGFNFPTQDAAEPIIFIKVIFLRINYYLLIF
jgi:hypothetical protein